MKNSSATTAAPAPPAPTRAPIGDEDPGEDEFWLTDEGEGTDDGAGQFTVVTRSKHRRNSPLQGLHQNGVASPPPPSTTARKRSTYKDPFGLTRVSGKVNPVSARTKQSARRFTTSATGEGTSSKLFTKGARLDATAKAKPKDKATLPRNKYTDPQAGDEGWETDPDAASSDEEAPRDDAPSGANASPHADIPGRFNGRVHETPTDGSCGAHALLEALNHLASTRGIHLILPDTAQELREVLVDEIAENLDLVNNEFPVSMRTQLTGEYIRPVSATGARQTLLNPDLSAVSGVPGVVISSIQDYLDIMTMEHTHLDEFTLAACARIWNVRVAVIHRQDNRMTTDNSQLVPDRPVDDARTIFLVQMGGHFEGAHANSTGCDDPSCHSKNKKISARHVPFHRCGAQTTDTSNTSAKKPSKVVPQSPSSSPAPSPTPNRRPTQTDRDSQLQILIDQLLEEYPGISPERADAALKLTKQHGRYSVYRAAQALAGQEGAPIVLHSPVHAPRGASKRADFGSLDFNSSSSEEGGGEDQSDPRKRAFTAGKARRPRSRSPPGDGAGQASKSCGCCGHHAHNEQHANHAQQQPLPPANPAAPQTVDVVDRALQYAAEVISITTRTTLQAARAALCKHMIACGNLTVAVQRACSELMDGAPTGAPANQPPQTVELPDEGEGSLAERHFGAAGRTPTIRSLAQSSRQTGSDRAGDAAQPSALFRERLPQQMQNAGASLTAAQRIATSMRRTEQQLFEEARDARMPIRRLQDELDDDLEPGKGDTPASAALATARSNRPASAPPAAAFHASPVVRVAQKMQARREQAAHAAGGTVIVVNSNSTKLPTWKAGAEAEGKGFNWKTKQRMVNAWEQYQLAEGHHAPKSFKSMIDVDLIPLICAECQLDETQWETLDDVTLLVAIEDKLKPHDAMGFTVQLKQVPFVHDETKGTLTQRYRLYAETFLAIVSEAKAAGCPLPDNVVKLAFRRALSVNPILQGWLEQEQWVSAAETHRRITNSLKMVDAYQMLAEMRPNTLQQQQQQQPQQQPQQQVVQPQNVGQQQHAPPQAPPAAGQHQGGGGRQARFNGQLQAAVNQALAAYQQAQLQQQPQLAQGAAPPAAHVNAAYPPQHGRPPLAPLNLPQFPGLDERGISWHVHSAMLGCRVIPCNVPFCQCCGRHGHTANECRKRFYNNPEANMSGYWSIQRPNTPPLRQAFPANPQPRANNVAVQAGQAAQNPPPFPVPHFVNGNANAASGGSNQSQPAAAVNNSAQQPANNAASGGQQ